MAKKSIPRKTKSGKPAARRKAVKKHIPTPIVTNEELMEYYKGMLLMRRFEEKAGQMYGMGSGNACCFILYCTFCCINCAWPFFEGTFVGACS